MDKLCAKCGKQLQPDQGFCENCGLAWKPSGTPATPTAPEPVSTATKPVVPQTAAPASPPASKSSSKGGLIVAIVVVLALGIGAWLFLRHRTADGSQVASSSVTAASTTKVTSSPTATAAPAGSDTALPVPMASASGETLSAMDAATATAASSKPCSVITRAEMETILGTKVVKMTTNDMTCQFYTDDTSSADVETTWTGGKVVYEQIKGYNREPGNLQAVTGIGDEAYFPATNVLHALKGDTYVVVNARVYPNPLETESAVARKVMEKLK